MKPQASAAAPNLDNLLAAARKHFQLRDGPRALAAAAKAVEIAPLTASAGQVHSAVYRSSVGRWKRYAPFLEETRARLEAPIGRHERALARRGIA